MRELVSILRAKSFDAIALSRIDNVSFPDALRITPGQFSWILSRKGFEVWTVGNDIRHFGFITIRKNDPRKNSISIHNLAVLPKKRKQGYARDLMGFILNRFIKLGYTAIELEVSIDNSSAQALYESLGFRVKKILNDYYSPGEHAYLMGKRLRKPKS